jgi:predicted S18 family serine protease
MQNKSIIHKLIRKKCLPYFNYDMYNLFYNILKDKLGGNNHLSNDEFKFNKINKDINYFLDMLMNKKERDKFFYTALSYVLTYISIIYQREKIKTITDYNNEINSILMKINEYQKREKMNNINFYWYHLTLYLHIIH